jgi:hypothetical protein
MLQIYRVQHNVTKVGPFQTSGEFTQALAKKAIARPNLKSPGEDGLPLGHIPFFFVFGCPDMDTLKKWFLLGETPAENERIILSLKQQGFVLAEYLVDADDYRLSTSGLQVAFDTFNAHAEGLVQFRDLDELLAEHALTSATRH